MGSRGFLHAIVGALWLALACLGWGQDGLGLGLANRQFKPESKAQKIRRLMANAEFNNPAINPVLQGSIPWTISLVVPYAGYIVSNGGLCYQSTGTGTTASSGGGPTGSTAGITDGTVTWNYCGLQNAPTMQILSSAPAYLSTKIQPNDYRIHFNGGIPSGSSTLTIPSLNAGLGGSGQGSNGAVQGATSLVNGSDVCDFGFDILTDAPIISFQVGNSIPGFNVIVRDAATNAYIASYPTAGNAGIGDNYITLDFTGIGSNITNGGAISPTVVSTALTGWGSITAGQGYSAANPPDIYFSGVTGSLPNAYAVISASGQLTTPTITYGGNITGGTLAAKIVTNRHKRRITFVAAGSVFFKGIFVSSLDSVWASPTADHLTVSFLGDSWTYAIGTVDTVGRQSPMCVTFAQLLGADNWTVVGVGSTDYATPMVPYNSTVTSGAFSSGSQTITVASINATMGGGTSYPLLRGDPLTVDYGLSTQETVYISSVSGSTITATFSQAHAAGCAVTTYVDPFYCRTAVTTGAITSSGSGQTITVATVNNAKGSSSGITTNSLLFVDAEGNPEVIKATSVSGTNITAVFTRNHAAGFSAYHVGTGYRVNHYIRVNDAAWAPSAVFANKSGDTGNGTCSTVTIAATAIGGIYTFTATSATMFKAINPAGMSIPNLTVGQQYSYGGLTFTVTAGGAAYVTGDVFTIVVNQSPDVIVIGPAGLNDSNTDGGASAAVVQTEVTKLYKAIRANCPYAVILWYGCNSTTTGASQVAVDAGIYAGISPYLVSDPLLTYVPVVGDPNGFWQMYTTAGLLNPATGHPSTKGYSSWGFRMLTDSVKDFLRQLVTIN